MAHTLGEEVIRAHVGDAVEITVAGTGTTGYLWRMSADDSKVRVIDHRVQPNTESFGGIGEEAFVLQPLEARDTPVTFRLETPWDENPAEVHTVMLNSEAKAATHE